MRAYSRSFRDAQLVYRALSLLLRTIGNYEIRPVNKTPESTGNNEHPESKTN